MEFDIKRGSIIFHKNLNTLDEMALEFSSRLSLMGIKHSFLLGYVAILFGRNRASEDIDVVCQRFSLETFEDLWGSIIHDYDCIITNNAKEAYVDYLNTGLALRFARKGYIIPNIEMKFATNTLQHNAISKSIIVTVNQQNIPISPMEQQIAYKLFLGSGKDIEDARFLFKLFREHLDTQLLNDYIEKLEIPETDAQRQLGWN